MPQLRTTYGMLQGALVDGIVADRRLRVQDGKLYPAKMEPEWG